MLNKNKILHIITSLGDGGAEGVLYRLVTSDVKNKHIVVSLMSGGKYQSMLEEKGIEVICLGLTRGNISIKSIKALIDITNKTNPILVQTWMYHSDLIGGLIAKLCGVKNVFWNIRHSHLKPETTKKSTIFIAKICAVLSGVIPSKIICCADEAKSSHVAIGYRKSKMHVIGNGYDLSKFKSLENEESLLGLSNEIKSNSTIIGMVGRYTPEKDHDNLFKAISFLVKKNFNLKLVLAGVGMDSNNNALMSQIDSYEIQDYVILLGPVKDVPLLMNQLDLHVLSSSTEGFPNVLAEAMACEVPCVSTNAGSAELIVSNTGWVVPVKDSKRLSEGILSAIHEMASSANAWSERKLMARARVISEFSLEKMINEYNNVWFE